MNRHSLVGLALLALPCLLPIHAIGGQALHLPADGDPEQARPLIIHAALDLAHVRPLLNAFHRRHPRVDIVYRNLTTLSLHERFLGRPEEVDVMISSAMPWQFALANAGHARPLDDATLADWPTRAHWRRELIAFTFEPIVMVVHRDLAQISATPNNHGELLALLLEHRQELKGRVASYDPVQSGAGYAYAMEESRRSPRYWDLIAALGGVDARLMDTTAEMLDGLEEGHLLIGYNLLGSYAAPIVEANPELTLIIPDDYALVTRRLAFVPRRAPHPDTATLFMEYLMSRQGQRTLAEETSLGALHPALKGPGTATELRERFGDALHSPRLGPGLLVGLDRLKRQALLARFRREFQRESIGVMDAETATTAD